MRCNGICWKSIENGTTKFNKPGMKKRDQRGRHRFYRSKKHSVTKKFETSQSCSIIYHILQGPTLLDFIHTIKQFAVQLCRKRARIKRFILSQRMQTEHKDCTLKNGIF